MKTKSLLFIVVICSLSHGGMVQAQQEKGQGDMAGSGLSPSEYHSYMGGKEHYLADSPNYMPGKKHYLGGDPFSDTEKIGRGKEEIPVSRGEMASGERKKSEEQGETQVEININVIPRDTPKEYGVIYLPVVPPKHHRGAVKPPPHVDPKPPQTGNFNPNVNGGFHQSTIPFSVHPQPGLDKSR